MDDRDEEKSNPEDPLIDGGDEEKDAYASNKKSGVLKNILYCILAIAVLTIVTVITTVLIIVYGRQNQEKNLFSFDNIFESNFQPRVIPIQWSKVLHDNEIVFTFWSRPYDNSTYGYSLYHPQDNSQDTLITYSELKKWKIPFESPSILSYDAKKVFLKLDKEKIWRHSSLGNYKYYDIEKNELVDFLNTGKKKKNLIVCQSGEPLVAYVEDNNIFLYNYESDKTTQITDDGEEANIFNGVADWLYEEEVLAESNTMYFNSDCSKILYMKLNDTQVKTYYNTHYEEDNPYPEYEVIKYPVVGEVNPIPSIWVWSSDLGYNQKIDFNTHNEDCYVYDFNWIKGKDEIYIVKYSRDQQERIFFTSDVSENDYTVKELKKETTTTWFNYRRNLYFYNSGKNFALITENKDRFGIGLFHRSSPNKPFKSITGDFDVTKIVSITDDHVFFNAINSFNGNFYQYNFSNSEFAPVNEDGYHEGSVDPFKGKYFMLDYLGPDLPAQYLKSSSGENICNFNNNDYVKDAKKNVLWPKVTLEEMQFEKDGQKYDVMTMKPPYFHEADVYPVVIFLYGGPGSKKVSQKYSAMNNLFHVYLTSNNFIVMSLDGRGTAGRGHSFMTKVFKHLGKYETEDQIAFKKKIESLQYVDSTKISIWGWSYGGYMSLNSAIKDQEYQLSIAVAPLTNPLYYDSAYTERYMGLLETKEDIARYKNSSVITKVGSDSFKDTYLLLCIGLYDDNVHPLNSFNLISKMQEYEVQMHVMIFPNKDHSLDGDHVQKFLYKKIGDELLEKGK